MLQLSGARMETVKVKLETVIKNTTKVQVT